MECGSRVTTTIHNPTNAAAHGGGGGGGGSSSASEAWGHVVNVSALEGKFAVGKKSTRHPHTNMSKAALNMLTFTRLVTHPSPSPLTFHPSP